MLRALLWEEGGRFHGLGFPGLALLSQLCSSARLNVLKSQPLLLFALPWLSGCLLPEARTLSYRVSLAAARISARITSQNASAVNESQGFVVVLQNIMDTGLILCVLIH